MLIKIKNLEIACNIGVYDWERDYIRNIIINIDIGCASDNSCFSDNINDTIDYETIYKNVKNIIASKKYKLIEALASDILNMILTFDKVNYAKVEIDKLKIFDDVYSCAVVLEKRI